MSSERLYDIVLKNGHTIDPLNRIDEKRDVAIADGKIAAVYVTRNPDKLRHLSGPV
jgi:dihydroorotase